MSSPSSWGSTSRASCSARCSRGPRGRDEYGIRAASPLLDGKRLELRAGNRQVGVLATGEIPSRAAAAGALPTILRGSWQDDASDRRWANPTAEQLFTGIDRFHLPGGAAADDSTWAEWHYFNVVLDDERWLYLTFLVGGRVATTDGWGGRILLTVREPDGAHRSLTRDLPAAEVSFDTASPDLTFGADSYVRLDGNRYRVSAALPGATVELTVRPHPHRWFPPTDIGGTALVSGYVVPALFASASGRVCLGGSPDCEPVRAAQAYHDHNWGVWRNVAWEWGTASDSTLSLLYGAVRGDSAGEGGVFAYLVDDRGPVGIFRPREMRVAEWQTISEGGLPLRVPEQLELTDPRQGFSARIAVEAVHVTDMQRPRDRFFVQMRGTATVTRRGSGTGPPSRVFRNVRGPLIRTLEPCWPGGCSRGVRSFIRHSTGDQPWRSAKSAATITSCPSR